MPDHDSLPEDFWESENPDETQIQKIEEDLLKATPIDLPANFFEEPAQAGAAQAEEETPEVTDLRFKLSKMKIPEKLKVALYGNSVCRRLLIMDGNKIVQRFVLKNPKLQTSEVEMFVKNPNLSEMLLRMISDGKEWMRSYAIKYCLVVNPRTPQDVSLKWMRFLNVSDIKKISKSKNIPQLVVMTARKRVADMDKEK